MRNLTGVMVTLTSAIARGANPGLPAGSSGKVVWDEEGAEVIVEFDGEMFTGWHDGLPRGRAWVPRCCLAPADSPSGLRPYNDA